MRTYQSVWMELRRTHKVVLEVRHEKFLPNLKRMISKEKYMDKGFILLNEIEQYKLQFSWNKKKLELTIELKGRYNLVPING